MARIRQVKPSLWSDEKLIRCTLPARLTFIGLLNESDDQGRQLYSPTRVMSAIFPLDKFSTKRVAGWVRELTQEEIIHLYEDERGRTFLCIPNLRKHQVVSRPTPSVLPPCPTHGELKESPPGDSTTTHGVTTGAPPGDPAPVLVVGSGRGTGNGKGKNQTLAPTSSPRERDLLFEALCEATGLDYHELTKSERDGVNQALKQIRDVNATPEQVFTRAENYPTHFATAALTASALARHWAQCARSGTRRLEPGEDTYREAMRLRAEEVADAGQRSISAGG